MTITASSYNASFTMSEILAAVNGRVVSQEAPSLVSEQGACISTDSRTIAKGDFFVPLSGPSFDGHKFLTQVFEAGACGAFVASQAWEENQSEWANLSNLIMVEDPQHAYQQLATYHRKRVNPEVIGITGSSGKTTVKELLYAALNHQMKTQKTEKNFNNEIGVPKTLLALELDTRISIVEMAMRGLDQISPLSLCARPNIAVINNIGPAHIGLLGSLDNVAKAKLEIVDGLDAETGFLIVNADDELLLRSATEKVKSLWGEAALERLKTYTLQDAENITATEDGAMTFNYMGQSVTINQPGMHMVSNALCVLKVSEMLGRPLDETISGLSEYQPISGRWEKQALPNYENACVIDDAYNANPSSFKASLEAFLSMPKPAGGSSVLILGGMKELGDNSDTYHRDLGKWLAEWLKNHTMHRVKALIAVAEDGALLVEAAKHEDCAPVFTVDTVNDVKNVIEDNHIDLTNTFVFIKGSRSVGLDKVAELLKGDS